MDCTIRVAKTKALISFVVTAKLICVFVFALQNVGFLMMRLREYNPITSLIRNFKPLATFSDYTAWFESDLVRNPKAGFLMMPLI